MTRRHPHPTSATAALPALAAPLALLLTLLPHPAAAQCSAIAAGGLHSLAVMPDGTVQAWGLNVHGQLGDGTVVDSALPRQVRDATGSGWLSGIRVVAANHYSSYAVAQDGSVWAWGRNELGQLGNGSLIASALPVRVRDTAGTGYLTGVRAIAAGMRGVPQDEHVLALLADGSVVAWGSNSDGQLGDGTQTSSSIPVRVKDASGTGYLGGVLQVAATSHASAARMADGSVWGWGRNSKGELALGMYSSHSPLPVAALDPGGILPLFAVAIAGGEDHLQALTVDGRVLGWGYNAYYQIGSYTPVSPGGTNLPQEVQLEWFTPLRPLTSLIQVAAGGNHALAVRSDGSVWAWGSNVHGALGYGENVSLYVPIQVKDASGGGFLSDAVAVSAGAVHSLVLDRSGALWAFGDNVYGELGDGLTTPTSPYGRFLPVRTLIAPLVSPDVVPGDAGNVLRATRSGSDVALRWAGPPATLWAVYRGYARDQTNQLPVGAPLVATAFDDAGRVPGLELFYYRVRGLSPCTRTPGP